MESTLNTVSLWYSWTIVVKENSDPGSWLHVCRSDFQWLLDKNKFCVYGKKRRRVCFLFWNCLDSAKFFGLHHTSYVWHVITEVPNLDSIWDAIRLTGFASVKEICHDHTEDICRTKWVTMRSQPSFHFSMFLNRRRIFFTVNLNNQNTQSWQLQSTRKAKDRLSWS
jgi:hypothetical protein